jgi:hypothetical protein
LRVAAIEIAEVAPSDPTLVASPRDETTKRQGRGAQSQPLDEPSGVSRVAMSSTLTRMRRRWRERVAMGASTTLAVLFGAVLVFRALSPGPSAGPIAAAATAPPVTALGAAAAGSPALVDHADAYVHLAPASLPAAPPPPPAPSPAPAVERKPGSTPTRAHAAPTSPSHTSAKPKAVDCDLPFTIDENGHKHYKPACLD